ncbi:hypothetical protein [Massilia sp. IC2-476]|uniref:hypothetical protein n=1 Tax=Massilia sp. IC2-476 TaxID=2887199 RepID=UPI001D107D36|nr:hypothetical protein [Massilia sp. IC2-476]MCC2971332.1 hypothetical protein [Massilia sp. IC2-476]
MFSLDDFAQLQFLQGRWKGVAPDGKEFFEEYTRPEPAVFQSHRFPDSAFTGHTDGATISLKDGEVISQWGDFTWKASSIAGDSAAFEPVNAPSQFTWRRVDDATLEARQRWTADGKEQEFTLQMTKLN